MSDDLKVIFAGKEVKVGDEVLKLMPMKFGQLPKALQIVQKLGALFMQHYNDKTLDEPGAIIEITALGGEDLIELVAFGIGKPREWFDTIEADEGMSLVISFIEVNGDFFIKRVLPSLNKNLESTPLLKKAKAKK